MTYIESVNLFVDGGCRGNPGPGAIGIIIKTSDNKLLHEYSEVIGHTTNNQAEYSALVKGLELCAGYTRKKVNCFSDCQLLINQVNAIYRIREPKLFSLFQNVKNHERAFEEVVYQYLNRNNPNIKRADRILNNAFEGRSISRSYPY